MSDNLPPTVIVEFDNYSFNKLQRLLQRETKNLEKVRSKNNTKNPTARPITYRIISYGDNSTNIRVDSG